MFTNTFSLYVKEDFTMKKKTQGFVIVTESYKQERNMQKTSTAKRRSLYCIAALLTVILVLVLIQPILQMQVQERRSAINILPVLKYRQEPVYGILQKNI